MESCNGGNIMKKVSHVVVISYPATGHTNPMLQFSKSLAARGLIVTFVSFNVNKEKIMEAEEYIVQRLKLDIRFECIPDGIPHNEHIVDSNINPAVFNHMQNNMDGSGVEQLICRLNARADSPPVACIVFNSFLPWVAPVAKKLQIPLAFFWTQSAAVFSIYFHFLNCEEREMNNKLPENVVIPGLPELKPSDLPSAFTNSNGFLNHYLRQLESAKDASWVLANTFYGLEPQTINSLTSNSLIPFLPIGPSIPSAFLHDPNSADRKAGANPWKAADCIEWLNEKPHLSVLYISFGSIAVICPEQIKELALGIQRSGRNFLWVIRPPPGHGHIGQVLPAGFLKETAERGLVVEWCCQVEVLSHPSVGVFMSHCGWNSTLDSLSLGVPVLTLDIWTDQPTNAKCLADVWKTGLRMRKREDGIVTGNEIQRCLKIAFESEQGKQMRINALQWRELATSACSDGGSSDANLRKFIQEIIDRTV